MARGGRKLAELIDKLDLIIEVRDARAPFATSSPLTEKFKSIRPVVHVLSKSDLADPEITDLWLKKLAPDAYAVDLKNDKGVSKLRRDLIAKKPEHRELRLAVMGIPNVGKSMLLNALAGKSQAQVGGIPGVTRSVSWYKNSGLLIVDSPGILDPHAEPGVHQALSWLGCARADILTGGFEAAALELINFLSSKNLLNKVLSKWQINLENINLDDSLDLDNNLDDDLNFKNYKVLEIIGRRLGCLISGGAVNVELAGRRFLDAFSSGKLTPVTLETPDCKIKN